MLFKRLILALLVSSIPLLGVIIVWLITIGSFKFISVVHSQPFLLPSALFVALGIVLGLVIPEEDLDDFLK